jgi:hypothetical protein
LLSQTLISGDNINSNVGDYGLTLKNILFIISRTYTRLEPDSAVGIVTKIQAEKPSNHGLIPGGSKRFRPFP